MEFTNNSILVVADFDPAGNVSQVPQAYWEQQL